MTDEPDDKKRSGPGDGGPDPFNEQREGTSDAEMRKTADRLPRDRPNTSGETEEELLTKAMDELRGVLGPEEQERHRQREAWRRRMDEKLAESRKRIEDMIRANEEELQRARDEFNKRMDAKTAADQRAHEEKMAAFDKRIRELTEELNNPVIDDEDFVLHGMGPPDEASEPDNAVKNGFWPGVKNFARRLNPFHKKAEAAPAPPPEPPPPPPVEPPSPPPPADPAEPEGADGSAIGAGVVRPPTAARVAEAGQPRWDELNEETKKLLEALEKSFGFPIESSPFNKAVLKTLAQDYTVRTNAWGRSLLTLKNTKTPEYSVSGEGVQYTGKAKDFGPAQAFAMAKMTALSVYGSESISLKGTPAQKYLIFLAIRELNKEREPDSQISIRGFAPSKISAELRTKIEQDFALDKSALAPLNVTKAKPKGDSKDFTAQPAEAAVVTPIAPETTPVIPAAPTPAPAAATPAASSAPGVVPEPVYNFVKAAVRRTGDVTKKSLTDALKEATFKGNLGEAVKDLSARLDAEGITVKDARGRRQVPNDKRDWTSLEPKAAATDPTSQGPRVTPN